MKTPFDLYREKVASGEIDRVPASAPTNPRQRFEKHDTRKTAIEAFCWQCMGGEVSQANGAVALIRACPSGPDSINPCPLHGWRPYK